MRVNKERRRFLKKTLQIGGGICASAIIGRSVMDYTSCISWGGEALTTYPSDVVIARNDNILAETGNLRENIVSGLLHKAVMQLTNAHSQEKAWQSLFRPDDIVGIKLNCLSGKKMSPHVTVVESILQGLKFAGVKEKNINAFERLNREPETTGL